MTSKGGQITDLALSDQIALGLGRMMMRFAALEYFTRHTLHRALDLEDDEHAGIIAMTSSLSFRKVREALLAVVRQQMGESSDWIALRAILRRASKAEDRRNALTHSAWMYNRHPDAMFRHKLHISASGNIRSDQEAFRDVEQLDAFVAELNSLTQDLVAWYIQRYLGIASYAT